MKISVPGYYPEFRCIADRCRHNCCIGWEIDIDEDTLAFYETVDGGIGVRLRENIDYENPPHFRLGENERCPFLNDRNLCDIYTELGEEHLCAICSDHPRFRNCIAGVCEMGLGLSCEAAAELILTYEKPFTLIDLGEEEGEESVSEWELTLLELRFELIGILTDRILSVKDRVEQLAEDCLYARSADEWREFYLSLERMDADWEKMLGYFTEENLDWSDILPETAWEQLIVYFVYRHATQASDGWDFDARLAFSVLSYAVIRTVAEGVYREKGEIGIGDLVEIARMYSSEIEYSEENTAELIGELDGMI